jgi:pimeloyl-ACP methyl ester carboxylesterase
MPSVKNVILVHGAWADGSAWSKVILLLKAKGLQVTAAQLTLMGLATDVDLVKRAIDAQPGPVILAGHSYGGAVITEAGNHPNVKGLVYVAAFAPEEGESVGGLASKYPATELFGQFRPLEEGYILLTEDGVNNCLAQDLSAEERVIVAATQGPTHESIFASPISKAAWRTKAPFFVIATEDKAIAPQQQQDTAKRMAARTLTVPTSHVPMMSKPKEVAEFIAEAAELCSA